MTLQKTIGAIPWGIEGGRASQDLINGEPMCKVKDAAFEGRFNFWGDGATDRQNKIITQSGTAASIVAGFAERWLTRPKFDPTVPGSLSVPRGDLIHSQTTGTFFAVNQTAGAKAGWQVYARVTDGAILAAEVGGTAPTDGVKTGFYIEAVDPDAMDAAGAVAAGALVKITSYTEAGAK